MDNFATKAIEYFNKSAKELASCVVAFNPPTAPAPASKSLSSSHKNVPTINLSDLGAHLENLRIDHDGKLEQIYKSTSVGWIGIDKNNISVFSKLINGIFTKVDWIEHKTLEDIAFEWIISEYLGGQKEDFFTYLENWKSKNVREYNVFFMLKNLAIETPFHLGKSSIMYFTEESLDAIFKRLKHKPNKLERKLIKNKFLGSAVAVCHVSGAEINKARGMAFEECALSVDTLKMFSPVIESPQQYITFDLDSRTLDVIYEQDVLAFEVTTNSQSLIRLNYSFSRPRPSQLVIDNEHMDSMSSKGIGFAHKFLAEAKKTELCQLIIQSIRYFGAALSQSDLHRRIVDVFTVMESLVLRNEDDGILSTLTTYIPKIVTKDLEDRKSITSMIKRMYKIRSGVIHHGKKGEFEMHDLVMLQKCLRLLIINMIELTDKHTKKESILQEIDNAINQAY